MLRRLLCLELEFNFTFFKKNACNLVSFVLILCLLCDRLNFDRFKKEVQPMAKCEICSKEIAFGIRVSHSHRRSNRTWKPNVKRVKAIVNGSPCRVYACTRCLYTERLSNPVWSVNAPTAFIGVERREVDSRFSIL